MTATTTPTITYEAAQRAGACVDGLEWLAYHGPVALLDIPWPDWRAWAIEHMPDHARPHLDRLVGDDDEDVRRAVARHSDAGPLLGLLAGDGYWRVRRSVALHLDAGPLLPRLVGDAHWQVRLAVAQHHDAGPLLLDRLAEDADWVVRHAVASRRLAA